MKAKVLEYDLILDLLWHLRHAIDFESVTLNNSSIVIELYTWKPTLKCLP